MKNGLSPAQIIALSYINITGLQGEIRQAKKVVKQQLAECPENFTFFRAALLLEQAEYNLTMQYIGIELERRANLVPDEYLYEIKALIYKA